MDSRLFWVEKKTAAVVVLFILTCLGCAFDENEFVPREVPAGAAVIVIGDSVMDYHREEQNAIADIISEQLGEPVYNASVSGAYFTSNEGEAMDIRNQYIEGDWQWLVVAGGGNDLNDECGCSVSGCVDTMNDIISGSVSSGALPKLVSTALAEGVRIVIMGYYSVPPTAEYGFAGCNDVVSTYSGRMALLADNNENVWFVDAGSVMSPANLDAYDDDHVHPSELGSRLIGQAIASQILAAEQ